jgi:formyl-CoA transferase
MQDYGALKGLKVLDLGRVLAGPYCGAILADLGADVIKIEEPKKGDDSRYFNPFVNGESSYFMQLNRNKRGITLNLRKGKNIFLKMVKEADVILENFRPGTMEKLGLGYEQLKKINPKIIYAAVSGFGQYGPYRDWPCYDLMAQGMSGIMSVTGWPQGKPTRAGAPVGDVLGGLMVTIGILAALRYRSVSGIGQMVDVSLVDSVVASMATVSQLFLAEDHIPGRNGNAYESAGPLDSFQAKDGDFILAVGNDRIWEKLCALMKQEELLELAEFKTNYLRVQNKDMLKKIIEEWSSTQTVTEIITAMLEVGIPAAPINNVAQVAEDPHIADAREMFGTIDHPKAGKVKLTNQPIKMSETRTGIRSSSPMLGQHNQEIYKEFGFSPDEIKQFTEEGVI